jgi:hypothetical protein
MEGLRPFQEAEKLTARFAKSIIAEHSLDVYRKYNN